MGNDGICVKPLNFEKSKPPNFSWERVQTLMGVGEMTQSLNISLLAPSVSPRRHEGPRDASQEV